MPKQCSIIVQSLGSGAKQTRSKFWSCCLLADDQAAQVVKNPPAHAEDVEMQAGSLGQEDALEEGTATHSSILAWRIPGRGGHGNPLQYSCLENPRDRGA